VIVSTVHRAKGLEFNTCYVSASSSTFPHQRSLSDPERLEEEERLFYVAATRAKDTLHLTYSETDIYGRPAGPSRFLDYVEQDGGSKGDGGEKLPPEPAITTECPALTPLPVEPALTPLPVEPAPRVTPAGLSPGAARFGEARWQAALACAEATTAAEPRSDDGSRYVEVHRQGFEDLLGPLGFDLDAAKGQVIYRATDMLRHGRVALTVWTTIPPGGSMARAVGDDSIKVSIVYADGRDGRDRPLLRKQPYAARTRGWRLAVLDRIEKALGVVGPNLCQKCSAPTVERKTKDGTKFHGCSRYPDCKGD
jgi:hypothetical protein